MHDRPNKPIDEAIYWIEYVVRHKGAKHLQVPYIDMPLYQIYMLDIICVIFLSCIFLVLTLVFIGLKLFTCVKKSVFKEKNTLDSRKKKN